MDPYAEPDDAPSLRIDLPDELTGGVWANFAAVSHSPYEFTIDFVRLDFARQDDESTPGQVVSRVNLSPLMVTQLLEALDRNWQTYAARSMPVEVHGEDGPQAPDA